MINTSRCTEVEMLQAERADCFQIRWSLLVHMSCTKHHEDITIAILAESYPKTIYNMAPFEFANAVTNSTGVQWAECKNCTACFWKKGSNDQRIITMQLLVKNYPRIIYGIAMFGFGQNLDKAKERKGVKLQNYHTSIFRGGKVQNTPHHADQQLKLPQKHI